MGNVMPPFIDLRGGILIPDGIDFVQGIIGRSPKALPSSELDRV
jgi:hypothetical protein